MSNQPKAKTTQTSPSKKGRPAGSKNKTKVKKFTPPELMPSSDNKTAYRWIRLINNAVPKNIDTANPMYPYWDPVPASEQPSLSKFANKDGYLEIGGLTLCKSVENRIDWEKLAKNLQAALASEMKENESLTKRIDEYEKETYRQEGIIRYLESKVWKLFNSKE